MVEVELKEKSDGIVVPVLITCVKVGEPLIGKPVPTEKIPN